MVLIGRRVASSLVQLTKVYSDHGCNIRTVIHVIPSMKKSATTSGRSSNSISISTVHSVDDLYCSA